LGERWRRSRNRRRQKAASLACSGPPEKIGLLTTTLLSYSFTPGQDQNSIRAMISPAAFESAFGFRTRTDLQTGLKATIDWYQQQHNAAFETSGVA
jgi:hypothetical protein